MSFPTWILAVLLGVGTAFLSSCSALPSPAERRTHADALAAARHWRALPLDVGDFTLQAYVPPDWKTDRHLTIYIEGDGMAWLDGKPSTDPTPRDPLALQLALAHESGNAAYLARPCQFPTAPARPCAQRYWADARFAPEVIAATTHAIDRLKALSGASELVLTGYSGGGAVAVLVAAQRSDVTRIITVAGNLDIDAWTRLHGLPPLRDSVNPMDLRDQIATIPQVHFVGAQDRIVPTAIAKAFAAGFPEGQAPLIHEMKEFDHRCCWVAHWHNLQQQVSGE